VKQKYLNSSIAILGSVAALACTTSPEPSNGENEQSGTDAGPLEDAAPHDQSMGADASDPAPTETVSDASVPPPNDETLRDAAGVSAETVTTSEPGRTNEDGPNGTAERDGGVPSVTRRFSLLGPATPNEDPAVLTPESVVPRAAARLLTNCPDGGLLVWDGSYLARYSAAWDLEWEVRTADGFFAAGVAGIEAMALTPDCETFIGGSTFVGLSEDGVTGGTDAWTAKVDGSGDIVWSDQWATSGAEATKGFVVLDDGAVLALSTSSGQAPGHSPEVTGGPVIVRYGADGTREWIVQRAPMSVEPFGTGEAFGGTPWFVFTTDGDSFHTLRGGLLRTWTTEGELVAEAPVVGEWADDEYAYRAELDATYFSDIAFEPATRQLVGAPSTLGGCAPAAAPPPRPAPVPGEPAPPPTPVSITCSGSGAQFDLQGRVEWFAGAASDQEVIDDVEGVIWSGAFSTISTVAVTEDNLYFAGFYTNSYENGSIVRPTTRPAFVGMYDRSGERVWFRQFLLDVPSVSDTAIPPTAITHLVATEGGDVQVYFHLLGGAATNSLGKVTLSFENGEAL
jgi:hypothetical protein